MPRRSAHRCALGGAVISPSLARDTSTGVISTTKAPIIVNLGGVGDVPGTIVVAPVLWVGAWGRRDAGGRAARSRDDPRGGLRTVQPDPPVRPRAPVREDHRLTGKDRQAPGHAALALAVAACLPPAGDGQPIPLRECIGTYPVPATGRAFCGSDARHRARDRRDLRSRHLFRRGRNRDPARFAATAHCRWGSGAFSPGWRRARPTRSLASMS